MLAVSQVRSSNSSDEKEGEFLLEDINFDDIFAGFDDSDMLPDLLIDPSDIFVDFSFSSGEESGNSTAVVADSLTGGDLEITLAENESRSKDLSSHGEVEVVSARTREEKPAPLEGGKGRKPTSASSLKVSHGKKKAKVDWTPELHRRFVQAVEQLGVDKAVPSRILELMGIDCLNRHNIASHLQKYRSHRKHLLAREAGAASWSHRGQIMYSGSPGSRPKMSVTCNRPALPIIGFPPPVHQQTYRPLHVWGHPRIEHPQFVPVWARPPWAAPRLPHALPPTEPPYWHHPHYLWPPAQGTTCFPPPLMPARIPALPAPGIPQHPTFRQAPHHAAFPPSKHPLSQVQLDAQPPSESIDAAIEDVLVKPWLPLPLGLKPPSFESVMVELQKEGVAKVPPARG